MALQKGKNLNAIHLKLIFGVVIKAEQGFIINCGGSKY